MAIKGKTKSRGGSRRVVAAPPRPTLYVPKPPLWRRRWFLALAAVIVLGGTLTGVLLSLAASHRSALRERTAAAVADFQTTVESKFPPPPDSQATPPTGYLIYPTLLADLDKVAKSDKSVNGEKLGASLQTSAKASADAIEKLNIESIVPEDANVSDAPEAKGPGATRVALTESQFMIAQAFRLYQTAGGLMAEAAKATGPERAALVARAKDVAGTAQTLFGRGYNTIITLRSYLGTLATTPFPAAGGGA